MSDWKNVQYKDGKMRTSEGGGGGGSSTLAGLDDVDLNNLQDGQIIKWDATNEKFVNANESGGSSIHTYSTTEQVVAKWIDGSDIYEKTYVLSNAVNLSSSGATINEIDTSGMSRIINALGQRDETSSYTAGAGHLFARKNGNAITVYCAENMSGVKRIVLQYIKN